MGGRVLGIAAAAVIALLAGLWFLIGRDEPVAATAHDAPPATAQPSPTPAPPAPPAMGARTGSAAALPVLRRPLPTPTPTAEPATPPPALVEDAPKNPPSFKKVLAEQVLATENLVIDCNDKAVKAGTKLNGQTAVSFTLARRKDGKVVLEATGVEYSSIADQPVMDCIRDTASQINVEALPAGADAIIAYRVVRLKDGAVVENHMSEYSVLRPAHP